MTAFDRAAVLDRVDAVLGDGRRPFSLHEPWFAGREREYLDECIESTFVSSVGKFIDRFEEELGGLTGAGRAVAVVNGTAALHTALRLVGVRRDDDVLLPALTFVATANAVAYCGARCHFVDSEEVALGVDPAALRAYLEEVAERRDDGCYDRRSGRRLGALVVTHIFGQVARVEDLVPLADEYGIPLVEDAAESLGSTLGDRHAGTFGQVAALSFNGNKIITTGGGGALLTRDPEVGERAKYLTTTAKRPHPWRYFHDQLGYNYRMPNLNAALGLAQLEQLPGFLEKKRALTRRYVEAFADLPAVRVLEDRPGTTSNAWLNALVLPAEAAEERDRLLDEAVERGQGMRPIWTLMHRLPMYEDCPRAALPVAEGLEARVVNLPSSAFL